MEEQNKNKKNEKKETHKSDFSTDSQEEMLKLLEMLNEEIRIEKINVMPIKKTSFGWLFLLIETIISVFVGIGLFAFLKPFAFSSIRMFYIHLGIIVLGHSLVKIYLQKIKNPFLFWFEGAITYLLTIVIIILTTYYLPGILMAKTIDLLVYAVSFVFINDRITKLLKKIVRGKYGKIK